MEKINKIWKKAISQIWQKRVISKVGDYALEFVFKRPAWSVDCARNNSALNAINIYYLLHFSNIMQETAEYNETRHLYSSV